MERLYWCPIKFNNQSMFLVASLHGIKFISNPNRGISQIYMFYRHQSFEFRYQKSVTRSYQQLLSRYLNGDQIDNQNITFDLRGIGSRFAHLVWSAVLKIPYGEVRTLKQLARHLHANTQRVRKAICQNPVLLLIPTHRIIINSQKLGHFRENLSMKSQLLEIETIMRNVDN